MSAAAVQQLGSVLQAASEPGGQLPGALKLHWNNWKCGAREGGFRIAKGFLPKVPAVSARAPRNVHHLCSRSKKFKVYGF